uniref:Uncharacterized protein n=1 Tax=Setaria viridis TaxID=4556 RepID=A0A4U6WKS3_SETVI|nr:hypothetical protein SEVIR_1G363901v2 [Setaria viridis]
MSVQDCHAERSHLSNLGFEKQTIVETESLDRVGERVAVMLDQVIPMAKEIFSFMEISRSANAASAAAACAEDLPERRSLPPVLCHTRSPTPFKSAGHNPSDSAEVATPCQDGSTRHTEQLIVQELVPRQEVDEGGCTVEDGQTSRRDPPSTPTGDCVVLQLTPSSLSPHPLSAPPPSPVPLLGMPMLLQLWEAMQDDNASPALVSPTDAQPADEAAPTAQQGTVDVGDSAISLSMEAGQPSPSSSMDGNAAVPSLLAPPPLPAQSATRAICGQTR